MDLERLRTIVGGPPPAMPVWLDRAAERASRTPPRLRMLGAAAGLVVTAAAITGLDQAPYGPPVVLPTVARDVAAGTRLTSADVTTVAWPADLAPPDPASQLVGTTTLRALRAGQPVTADAVAPDGIAALVTRPDGVAYPLPDEVAPQAEVGAVLDLLGSHPSGSGVRLATGVRVLARSAGVLWCEVDREQAPALAGAGAFGRLVAVLVPDPAG